MSDILNQLKSLKENPKAGAVSASEHEAAKGRLLLAIGDDKAGETAPSFVSFFLQNFISKPIAASAAAFVIAVGSLSTVSAAANSLPGETLYSVKKITEQAQLRLASLDRRAVLHTEFAERRLMEANELREVGQESPVKETLAKEAMNEYKKELTQATADLKQMKGVVETKETLAAVSDVQNNIASLETEIEKSVGADEPVAAVAEVLEAKEATKEVHETATNVVVEAYEAEATELTNHELKEMFRKELGDIEARQTFDEHRIEVLKKIFTEQSYIFTKEELVTPDDFKKMIFAINQTELLIPDAMNGFAAGGYRTAFETLRGIDAGLIALEAKIAEIEITVTAAIERVKVPEDTGVEVVGVDGETTPEPPVQEEIVTP